MSVCIHRQYQGNKLLVMKLCRKGEHWIDVSSCNSSVPCLIFLIFSLSYCLLSYCFFRCRIACLILCYRIAISFYRTWCKWESTVTFTILCGVKSIFITLTATIVKFLAGASFVIVKEAGYGLPTATNWFGQVTCNCKETYCSHS